VKQRLTEYSSLTVPAAGPRLSFMSVHGVVLSFITHSRRGSISHEPAGIGGIVSAGIVAGVGDGVGNWLNVKLVMGSVQE
jgi:hypothetical protein